MSKPARGRPLPKKTVEKLKQRSMGYCEFRYPGCKNYASEIDHIKSRARMGSHELFNLAHVCKNCHDMKTANHPCSLNHRTHAWQLEGMGEDNHMVSLRRPDGTEFLNRPEIILQYEKEFYEKNKTNRLV